jgi:RNA polymerase sigma factor (sigma-70 family)
MNNLTFDIMARIARNDHNAMKLLQNRMQRKIMERVQKRSHLTWAEAQDFYQDVFIIIFDKYKNDPEKYRDRNLESYFETVTTYRLNNIIRNKKNELPLSRDEIQDSLTIPDDDAEEEAFLKEVKDQMINTICGCLSALKQEDVDILMERIVHNKNLADIADEKNMKHGTIRQKYGRAKAKLKELFNKKIGSNS